MERLTDYLRRAVELGGSDLFLIPGAPVTVKAKGKMSPLSENRMEPASVETLIREAYEAAKRETRVLEEEGDDDFSFAIHDLSRVRCNVYRQRGTLAATCRIVAFGLPDPKALHIPDAVLQLSQRRGGLILVTGPAGSGKSTTLACLIDRINATRSGHIVTIEDPIEYLHPHRMSLVSQREVPGDAPTFARALRAALRQDPDVIMLGEMRDAETIHTAITAAETGQLVLSSLHTIGAAKSIDRIVDAFPAAQQQQIRAQLSMALCAVVSQRLIPTLQGGLIPAFEVMTATPAIRTMIRDGRIYQIDTALSAAGQDTLRLDDELVRLCGAGIIDEQTAELYSVAPESVKKRFISR